MRSRIVVGILLLASASAAGAAPRISGELGYGYDSNANRARRHAGYERESQQVRGALAVETSYPLGRRFAAMLQGALEGQHDLDYDGLSNGKVTGLARLLFRPDGGFYTPTFALTGAASHWDFDSRQRDSAEYRAGLHVTGQITTRVAARLGWSAVWREARGAVFDLDAHSALIDLDWTVHPRAVLYAGYQYREGDLVATVPGAPGPVTCPAYAKACAADDAFGTAGDRVYRVAADAHIGTLGVNYALARALSLDFQGQFIEAEADLGTRYERWLSVASLLFRF